MRYPAISAGYRIASRDFANGANCSACPVVRSLTVSLRSVARHFTPSMRRLASGAALSVGP